MNIRLLIHSLGPLGAPTGKGEAHQDSAKLKGAFIHALAQAFSPVEISLTTTPRVRVRESGLPEAANWSRLKRDCHPDGSCQ